MFLRDLDPVFELRFPDASHLTVTVHPTEEPGRFALSEYAGQDHHSTEHHIDL
ncbi:hypothetical protein [Actinoplanes sp. NPDC026623]|uniref:hypothetical protein n=1 Tax=Actinoplanes sp. NPDC026623 TaxID=3155610 RepID=UPI0033DCB0E2